MAATLTSDLVAWERLPGEPSRAYHAFAHYRDLLTMRSVDKAWRQHKVACEGTDRPQIDYKRASKQWAAWAARWDWLGRAEMYDADLDRQQREKTAKTQQEARERHGRLAQGQMTVNSGLTRSILEAYQDPAVMKALTTKAKASSDGLIVLLQLHVRAASTTPSLVGVERMALGLTSESVEIHDKREVSTIGNRIAADPEATDLALALLDRLAGTGPGPAERPGAPGEPGDVAHGAASDAPSAETGGPGAATDPPTVRGDAPKAREE